MTSLFMFRLEGVWIYNGVELDEMHALIQQCTALVNSSISEGMPIALLEVRFVINGIRVM